jgi:hypothetical protein
LGRTDEKPLTLTVVCWSVSSVATRKCVWGAVDKKWTGSLQRERVLPNRCLEMAIFIIIFLTRYKSLWIRDTCIERKLPSIGNTEELGKPCSDWDSKPVECSVKLSRVPFISKTERKLENKAEIKCQLEIFTDVSEMSREIIQCRCKKSGVSRFDI